MNPHTDPDLHFARYPVALMREAAERRKRFMAKMQGPPMPMLPAPVVVVKEIVVEPPVAVHVDPIDMQMAIAQEEYCLLGMVSIKTIQRVVANHYGVTVLDIVSARRTAKIIVPRHVAIYLARTMTTLTLPHIGRFFGNRDHSSIHFAVRKITAMADADQDFAMLIKCLMKEIAPHAEAKAKIRAREIEALRDAVWREAR